MLHEKLRKIKFQTKFLWKKSNPIGYKSNLKRTFSPKIIYNYISTFLVFNLETAASVKLYPSGQVPLCNGNF